MLQGVGDGDVAKGGCVVAGSRCGRILDVAVRGVWPRPADGGVGLAVVCLVASGYAQWFEVLREYFAGV